MKGLSELDSAPPEGRSADESVDGARTQTPWPARTARWGLIGLPGAATVWLSFNAGGFFAGPLALAAVAALLLLTVRVTSVEVPFAGAGVPLVASAAALALFGAWVLTSSLWSESAARALLEYDRVLLYLATLVLFGSVAWTNQELRWMVRFLALGMVSVCVVAFLARTVPDLWSSPPDADPNRLSYPITYWNALGLMAAIGAVLCLALTSDGREWLGARLLAAAAVPVLAPVLLLTLSRGAIAAGVVGIAVFIVLGVNRSLLPGLLATVPATTIAATATYRSELLAGGERSAAVMESAGHDLALTVCACVVGAVLLRFALLPLDRALGRWRLSAPMRRRLVATAAAAAAICAVVAFAAFDGSARLADQYEQFADTATVDAGEGRDRLGNLGNNYRLDIWRVAIDSFSEEPLLGNGAGTFELTWAAERPIKYRVSEGHSLYAEVLSELGIVGCCLLLTAILVLLGGIAARIRGPARVFYAGLFAAAVTWVLHAGVDLDWEMPAVTLWVFVLGAAAISLTRGRPLPAPRRPVRVAIGLALLIVAVMPAAVLISQARLDDGLEAFRRGDCRGAIEASLDSVGALGVRPEPFQVLGYCDARLGHHRLARRAMRAAVRRDPDNWAAHYGLAVVNAAAGVDPRPAAAAALKLNPRTPFTRELVRRFRTDDPREWTRRARRTRLVIR
jgi:O-antigen ligase